VQEPITSYANLLERKDEFTNQIAIPDMYGDVAMSFYLGMQQGFDGADVTDPRESELLKGLAEMQPRYFESSTPLTNAVAAGEVKAGLYSFAILRELLKSSGAPIDGVADPAVSTSVNSYVAVTGWAKNPNAGQVFVDFLFSPEGQAAGAASHYTPVLSDVPGAEGDISGFAPFPELVTDKGFRDEYITQWKSVFNR
jgi:ABC-type Fe3+ transport system substrate-binding protein